MAKRVLADHKCITVYTHYSLSSLKALKVNFIAKALCTRSLNAINGADKDFGNYLFSTKS